MFNPRTIGEILAALKLADMSVSDLSKTVGRSRAAIYQQMQKDGDLRNLSLPFEGWLNLVQVLDEKLKQKNLNLEDHIRVLEQVRISMLELEPPA